MKNNPQVDILIISYNQEKYIAEAIEGAVNQTYENVKVIISDDCSTDRTRDIINSFYDKYPSKVVKAFNRYNLGITGNCNEGLKACKGEYFIVMGGDDILYSTKVEKQIKWFQSNPTMALCGHNLDLVDKDSKNIGLYGVGPKYGLGAHRWIKHGMQYGCLSIMIRRENSINYVFDTRLKYSSDLKFFIDFLGSDGKYGNVDEYLGSYRKTAESITSSKWEECFNDSKIMYKIFQVENVETFRKSIAFGISYNLDYGSALNDMNHNNYEKALVGFWIVIKTNPFLWKAYLRMVQSILLNIFSRE